MMKRLLTAALAVIFALSLVACGNDNGSASLPTVRPSDSSVLGTDFQKDMSQSSFWKLSNICESEDGYYFEWSNMVYYLDKDTGESTILCNKPDCSHEWMEGGGTCNAQVDAQMFLSYYDGKIFFNNNTSVLENGVYVDKGERLFSMNLDGTAHEVVQNLDFTPGADANLYSNTPMIHRGNVYFCYSGVLYTVTLGGDIEDAVKIYGDEIVRDGSMTFGSNEMYYELWADGDLVYFMVKNLKQSDGSYKDTLFRYDPQKNISEKIWQVPDKSEVGAWDTIGVSVSQWYISNGYIYFFLCGNDIWYTDLSTGKTNKLIDLDLEAGATAFSSEHIAVINKEYDGGISLDGNSSVVGGDTLYVYGYDGKLINEIALAQIFADCDTVSSCNLLWIDDGKVYVHADASIAGIYSGSISPKAVQEHYIYAIDIESGSLKQTGWSIKK